MELLDWRHRRELPCHRGRRHSLHWELQPRCLCSKRLDWCIEVELHHGGHGNQLCCDWCRRGEFRYTVCCLYLPSPHSSPHQMQTIYVGSADSNVYALHGTTGSLRWIFTTGGAANSSPTIGAKGVVFIGSDDGRLYALNGSTGAVIWSYATKGRVFSSPAIGTDGTVFVGSDDNSTYALDGQTGSLRWNFSTGGMVRSSPAIGADGTVYISSLDSAMYALNGSSGALAWRFRTFDDIPAWVLVTCSPSIGIDGTIVFGTATARLYALDGTTGMMLWSRQWKGNGIYSALAIGSDGTIYMNSGAATAYPPPPAGFCYTTIPDYSPCPTGNYCPHDMRSPMPCAPGSYSPTAGARTCSACPPGQYDYYGGATTCTPCPAGTYNSGIGAADPSQCLPCAPGTYSLTPGANICNPCGPGTYNPTPGNSTAAACVPAPVGASVSFAGAATFQLCSPGSFSALVGSSYCTPCPSGQATAARGATSCDSCAPGYAAQAIGSLSCAVCGIGTYAAGNGSEICTACPAGYFLDAFAATSPSNCTPCAAGRYNPVPGQGSSACFVCPAGTASPTRGATSPGTCDPCTPGHFSVSGAAACTECAAGYYAVSTGTASCDACPRGTYSTRPGAVSEAACSQCPSGRTTVSTGTSQLSDCVVGAFPCPTGAQPSTPGGTPNSASDCVPIVCGAGTPLSADRSGCTGCAPGLVYDPASQACATCPLNETCVGLVTAPLSSSPSSWAAAVARQAAVAPSAENTACAAVMRDLAASCVAGLALESPHSELPSAFVVTELPIVVLLGATAMLVTAAWFSIQRLGATRLAAVLRWFDAYATRHKYGPHECIRPRPTVLGGGCTLLAFGAIAGIGASIIAQRTANNSLIQVGGSGDEFKFFKFSSTSRTTCIAIPPAVSFGSTRRNCNFRYERPRCHPFGVRTTRLAALCRLAAHHRGPGASARGMRPQLYLRCHFGPHLW